MKPGLINAIIRARDQGFGWRDIFWITMEARPMWTIPVSIVLGFAVSLAGTFLSEFLTGLNLIPWGK